MAKVTTIIDIGSNSMRMVVFKKTSRFGFHLINESKSKVKISEGCYENNGNLQEVPMQRAFDTLKSFLNIAKNLKSRKILCVATSALRDAPNKKEFVNKVSKELNLNIKVIDGKKEAYYGGVAASNLIDAKDFSTIDIGGGSTEFAYVQNGKIEDTISLDIGTVRIKELYFNRSDWDGAKQCILTQLEKVPFKIDTFVGMGGTARALSRVIVEQTNYSFPVLHGFRYKTEVGYDLFDKILDANTQKELRKLGVRKDRFDTIKEGTFILKTILEYFGAQKVITSGVGVREGVYLTDILRSSNHKFPANFNVSMRSLLDRFIDDERRTAYLGNNARKIYNALKPLHNLDDEYLSMLVTASKLQPIGSSLNFYKNSEHSFNFILNGLTYGFNHRKRILIAHIIKFSKKSLPKKDNIVEFESLLPDIGILQWLSFMISLNINLNQEFAKTKYEYVLNDNTLVIKCNSDVSQLIQSSIEKVKAPIDLEIRLDS